MKAEIWSGDRLPDTHPAVLVADNDAAICGPDGGAVPADHA